VIARRQESVMALLEGWQEVHLVLDELAAIVKEVPTPGQKDLIAFWGAMFAHLATSSALAQDSLMNLWASAARDNVVPSSLKGTNGYVPLTEVYVTTSADLARRARRPDRLVVTLDEHGLTLWQKAGARSLDKLFKPSWAEILGPPGRLIFAIPEMATVLRPEFTASAPCQSFSGLSITFDETADPVPCLMWENTLLLDSAQLARFSRAQRLRLLVNEVAAAGWLQYEPAEALQRLGDAQVDERRAHVARGASLPDRLLRAVGGRSEPLQKTLGALATLDFVQKCSSTQLAELTLAQFGPATLSILKETLEAEGLKPPSRWNTAEARTFVASIGFPDEFAASPESRREGEEFISGPIELPPLHDFQEEVLAGVRNLVATATTRRRAVVSLPTGGGKTRVTVEAAVLLVLRPEGDRRSVVWVAQTDELCEQAVQAFRQVWINLGAQKTDLRIVRLWGGNSNPSIQELDKPVVVVASIQTLNSRMGTGGLVWLNKPGLVVVDECHHAITPSYTNLLRWLDAEAPRTDAPPKDEPPILGLSATPFRTNDDESKRLAKRFDNRWLPANQEQLHARLLERGVLARPIHEALQSGIGLSDDEISRLAQLDWEGLDFEKLLEEINQRLGKDKTRNERLVNRIEKAEERSILFFANSVQHAEEISARLNLRGIPAAAVSGGSATASRRYFLQHFQFGDIRVLCNHSVLSTGFDAPKTDMILIARQVFSPVRYMQMVGRGLRGLKNGGTAQCRIVTVMDNLGRFADRHPYHFCAEYFSASTT
jgi:superfamily II DNA or RNA helicase